MNVSCGVVSMMNAVSEPFQEIIENTHPTIIKHYSSKPFQSNRLIKEMHFYKIKENFYKVKMDSGYRKAVSFHP